MGAVRLNRPEDGDMKRLQGRKAIVTGAADGIGLATVKLFCAEGAQVIGVDLPGSALEAALSDIEGAHALPCDVATDGAPTTILAAARERLGGLDILFNNAGVCPMAPATETSDEIWRRTFEVNVTAVFRLSREAIPLLQHSDQARIINTGSVMSDFGGETLTAYAASKHAVAGLTKSMATELGPLGINVTYVQPGSIVTGITRELFQQEQEFRDYWAQKAAVRRLGQPEDIARVVLFLASADSAFVTGHGIYADGGAMQHV